MTPPDTWRHLPFFAQTWPTIRDKLAGADNILPPPNEIFAALETCAFEDVRVVILGQDPYPTPGHAHGFAFSVAPDVRQLPRSLSNIFKEMYDDLGDMPDNGDLRFWAEQGILLLNTALTVPAGKAGGHARLGWSHLTRDVLNALNESPRAFVLWGKHAQSFAGQLAPHHFVLESAHPSPLSARRGFFGSRPFSRVNDWLKTQGQTPIVWTHP